MVIYSESVSKNFRSTAGMQKYPYLNEAVADILKERRKALTLSKRKLSELARIERADITGLENGKWNMTLNVFFFLSEALAIEPEESVGLIMNEIENLKKGKRV